MARTIGCAALFAVLVLLAGADRPAGAQAIDWHASGAGLSLSHQPGSARLEAMGGLQVAVRDEDRELNLLDYGRNICGYLTDSDYRRWDFWQTTNSYIHDERDGAGVRTRTRSTLSEAGGRMSWRNGTSRVVGGDIIYDQWRNSLEGGQTTKTRGPMWGVFAAQKVSRLTLGAAIRMISDNEDVRSESVFAIRHESSGARGTGGVAVDLGTLQLGAQAELQSNTIRGLSRDESRFHEDKLTWKRPIETYDLSAYWNPIEAVTGAVRARITRLDGREEVKISWSDRMPSNPSRSTFLGRTGTFKESGDGTEVGSRWEVVPLEGVQVGARVNWLKFTDDVVEGKNYKGSRRAGHRTDTDLTGGGGASFETAGGKLRLGAEGWVLSRESKVRQIDTEAVTKARQVEFRSGAEYYLNEWLAVRGGFLRVAYDSDRDRPRTLQVGSGYTLGVGYIARGGLYQIDAAVRVMNLDPDYTGYPNVEDARTSITLGARFLL